MKTGSSSSYRKNVGDSSWEIWY